MRSIYIAVFVLKASTLLAQDHPFILRGKEHLQRGRYEEAVEAYAEAATDPDLTREDRLALALGQIDCLVEQGQYPEALQRARGAVEELPDNPLVWAHMAELQRITGQPDEAAKSVKQALDLDSQLPAAVLVYADLLADAGRYAEAMEQYRWFVRFYNRTQPKDAETMVTVGQGAAQYARWGSVAAVFKFIVNTICIDAAKADADCWQALVLSGDLLAEKSNRAQATPEYQAALAINPNCTAAHVGLGQIDLTENRLQLADDRADMSLAVNSNFLPALRLKADVALLSENHTAARPFLQRALAVNPLDQETLGRIAVCDLLDAGVPSTTVLETTLSNLSSSEQWGELQQSPFADSLAKVVERNPKPGIFLNIVAQFLDSHRKFAAAEVFYRAAIKAMPELSAPKTGLGMLCMRTGRIDEARTILDEAFNADQFQVRVSNMRKLLDVLQAYDVIETNHFVVHCDPAERVLGQEVAAYLESIYDELTTQHGYEPPTRTHFEIYSDAKDQNAHAWFSTRMSGLPWIQTIGASTGMIVALASPAKTQDKYNWARVVRHEFVHILTLQKTNFNIPHWYTEALAVTSEGGELQESWYDLLLTRVPADETFTMATLNQGFQRPRNRDDWSMAYCQSRLYARYFTERFGEESLGKLTEAYCNNPETTLAIPEAFGVPVESVEEGYALYLKHLSSEIAEGRMPGPPDLSQAQAKVKEHPDDASAQGELAHALIASRQIKEGFDAADKAHELDPKEPISATFLARRAMIENKGDEAVKLIEAAYDEEHPHYLILDVVGESAMRLKDYEGAERMWQKLVDMYPLDLDPRRDLLRAKTAFGRSEMELKPLMEFIAARDTDDVAVRKRLLRVALDEHDTAAAIKWGDEALHIDALDPNVHRAVALLSYEVKQYVRAVRGFRAVEGLDTLQDPERIMLARCLKLSGNKKDARGELLKITAESGSYKSAQTELKLLEATP